MKCNSKTMLSVGAALGVAALLAYFAFPAARLFILANAPLLVALICPVSMLVAMGLMNRSRNDQAGETDDSKRASRMAEAGRDNAG